jgi:hypothetical protein
MAAHPEPFSGILLLTSNLRGELSPFLVTDWDTEVPRAPVTYPRPFGWRIRRQACLSMTGEGGWIQYGEIFMGNIYSLQRKLCWEKYLDKLLDRRCWDPRRFFFLFFFSGIGA